MKIISIFVCLLLLGALSPTDAAAADAVPAKLSLQDKADLQRVKSYLENLKTLKGRFLQVASNGGLASGEMFLSRPGKMRFEYHPPANILMISDGLFLIYIDKDLDQVTHILLSSTPVGVLVSENVELSGDITVTKVKRSPGALRVTIKDTEEPEKGSITLVFSVRPFALRKWTVVDAQNIATEVSLSGVETGIELDPELFIHREKRQLVE